MKIVTINTLIEIQKIIIEKMESLKTNLYLLLKNDEKVLEDYVQADNLIKNAKKIIEELEEKRTIEETENGV